MVSQPVRERQTKRGLSAKRAAQDDALSRIERAAGILWRPDLPVLMDDELKREIVEAWAREAENRDRRTVAP